MENDDSKTTHLELLVVTQNRGKLKEFQNICQPMGLNAVALEQVGGQCDWREEGKTFRENALIKLDTVKSRWQGLAVSDDSGLVVPYLGGQPGVFSSRYAGPNATDQENLQKLLQSLDNVEGQNRRAFFVTCLAFRSHPEADPIFFYGCLRGSISTEPRGGNGFGYDPIFMVPGLNQTLASLPDEMKNTISHRFRALAKFERFLQVSLGER